MHFGEHWAAFFFRSEITKVKLHLYVVDRLCNIKIYDDLDGLKGQILDQKSHFHRLKEDKLHLVLRCRDIPSMKKQKNFTNKYQIIMD